MGKKNTIETGLIQTEFLSTKLDIKTKSWYPFKKQTVKFYMYESNQIILDKF